MGYTRLLFRILSNLKLPLTISVTNALSKGMIYMKFQVGDYTSQYWCSLATVALGILSAYIAALIGSGPISLLIFFLSFVFIYVGIALAINIFKLANLPVKKTTSQSTPPKTASPSSSPQ